MEPDRKLPLILARVITRVVRAITRVVRASTRVVRASQSVAVAAPVLGRVPRLVVQGAITPLARLDTVVDNRRAIWLLNRDWGGTSVALCVQ